MGFSSWKGGGVGFSTASGAETLCSPVSGLGFLGVQGLGFRVQGLGFRVQGLGFRVQGLGFRL